MRGRLPKLAALSLVALAGTAYTFGGWAVITVEDLPEYAVAGKPVELTFLVRQHGVSLLSNLEPAVRAADGSATVKGSVVKRAGAGRYTSTLVLPRTGPWTITIESGFMKNDVQLAPLAVIAPAAAPVQQALPVRGQHLFVAKGCATCHVHAAIAGSGMIKAGPDLTPKRYASDYLAKFLADPSIARTPGAMNQMPALEVKPIEVTALAAFLNADRAVSSR